MKIHNSKPVITTKITNIDAFLIGIIVGDFLVLLLLSLN